MSFLYDRDEDGQIKVKIEAFTCKTVTNSQGNKSKIYKRVHGIKQNCAAGGYTDIIFDVPYTECKFSGAELFNVGLDDYLDYTITDDVNNTYSGAPGSYYTLNQFGFNVRMPPGGKYFNTSSYDASLFQNMRIVCSYYNSDVSAKDVYMNIEIHEVVQI